MRSRRLLRRLWPLAVLFCVQVALAQEVQGESRLEPESVEAAAAELEALIRESVREAGGDLETQRLHLVLGFSTGHFSVDPLRAQASRLTAWELVDDLLLRGDQVSVYAFEMDLWEQPGSAQNPLTLPADHGPEKETVRSLFPMTPQADSRGGHDTELALTRIAQDVSLASGPVIVLFTNRAASLTTDPAVPIIGEDDPRYQAVLQNWRRVDQVNQTGASFEPAYDIVRASDELVTRSLDVVVLVPREFRAPPLAEGTRSERLAAEPEAPAETSTAARSSPSAGPAILILLLLLLLGGLAFFLLRRRGAAGGGGRVLSINSHRFEVSDVPDARDVVRLVGPGYRQANSGDERAIEVGSSGTPAQELARFVRSRKSVIVKDALFSLHEVDGDTVSAPYTLPADGERELVFLGEIVPEPGRPPREVTVRVTASLGEE